MSVEVPSEGGCRCGRVRFRLTREPMMEGVCHCYGCQRMTSSAFSTTLIMPDQGFEVIAGETVVGGAPSDSVEHHCCDACKTWVYTRMKVAAGFVNVRATLLDDASGFAPWMETQTAERLPWAVTGATKSFERFPAPDDYPALIAAYQATRRQRA